MMLVIASLMVALSFVMVGFLSLAPNVYSLIEKDFMRKVQYNAQVYGIKYGQLAFRAKTMDGSSASQKDIDLGYVKKRDVKEIDTMQDQIHLNRVQTTDPVTGQPEENVTISVTVKYQIKP